MKPSAASREPAVHAQALTAPACSEEDRVRRLARRRRSRALGVATGAGMLLSGLAALGHGDSALVPACLGAGAVLGTALGLLVGLLDLWLWPRRCDEAPRAWAALVLALFGALVVLVFHEPPRHSCWNVLYCSAWHGPPPPSAYLLPTLLGALAGLGVFAIWRTGFGVLAWLDPLGPLSTPSAPGQRAPAPEIQQGYGSDCDQRSAVTARPAVSER